MTIKTLRNLISFCLSWLLLIGGISCPTAMAAGSPLPSWKDGGIKETIIGFVEHVTNDHPNNKDFVKPEDRIAVFDNDGTLWTEKPCYIQESFILFSRRGSAYCPEDDSLDKSLLNDLDARVGEYKTVDEYKQEALQFLTTQKHPRFNQPYVKLTYQPMIELLNYLRKNDFQVYISSGGGMDFIRSFAKDAYGIPPQNVIGSTVVTELRSANTPGEPPYLVRTEKLVKPLNDEDGKPVGIDRYIGKKPIIAVGNSFGDLEMFQYTDDHQGHDLILLVNHDDPRREYYYTEDVLLGKTNTSIVDVARDNGWHVISMKDDFIKVFAWQ